MIGEPIGWRLAGSALLVAGRDRGGDTLLRDRAFGARSGAGPAPFRTAPGEERGRSGRRRGGRPTGCAARCPRAPRRRLHGVGRPRRLRRRPSSPPELRTEAGARSWGSSRRSGDCRRPAAPPPLVIQSREERRRYVVGEFSREVLSCASRRRAARPRRLGPRSCRLRSRRLPGRPPRGAGRRLLRSRREADGPRELADGRAAARRAGPRARPRPPGPARRPRPVPGRPPRARSDEGVARQALVEGEAVALAHDLSLRRDGRDSPRCPTSSTSSAPSARRRADPVARACARLPPDHAHCSRTRRVSGSSTPSDGATRGRSCRRSTRTRRGPRRRSSTRSATSTGERIRCRSRCPTSRRVLPPGSRMVHRGRAGRDRPQQRSLRRFLGEPARVAGWRGDRYALWDAARRALCSSSRSPRGTREAWRWPSRGIYARV